MVNFKLKIATLFLFLSGAVSYGQQQWSLNDMVAYAKEHNISLQQSQLNNQLLENNITSAQRQRLPSVNASIGNSLASGILSEKTGGDAGYLIYSNSLGVSADMIVYNHGEYKLNEEKAALDLASGEASLDAATNSITINIINQYLTVLLRKELLSSYQEQLQIDEELLRQNQIRYDEGSIPLSQIYETKSTVAQDKQNVAVGKTDIDEALFNLAQTLQLPDYRDFDVNPISSEDSINAPLLDINEIIDYAYAHQPVIKSAEIAVESAKKSEEIARTDLYPTVSASYGFNTNYSDYLKKGIASESLLNQWRDNRSHSIGLNVSIPIFNKNLTKLSIENSKLQTEIALKKVEQEKQSLKESVQAAYFNANSNYERYLASQEAVNSAQISLDFAKKSLAAGKITQYDFNQTATVLFNAKSQSIQNKYNYIFSLKILDFYLDKPLDL